MAVQARKRRSTPIPTDSFGDLAFLLIIFFILVTSLQKFVGFKASLPAGDKAAETKAETMPTVKLHNGAIHLNDEAMSVDQLRVRLRGKNLAGKKEEERIVIIEATGQVPYQMYYDVMATISAAGGIVGVLKEEN